MALPRYHHDIFNPSITPITTSQRWPSVTIPGSTPSLPLERSGRQRGFGVSETYDQWLHGLTYKFKVSRLWRGEVDHQRRSDRIFYRSRDRLRNRIHRKSYAPPRGVGMIPHPASQVKLNRTLDKYLEFLNKMNQYQIERSSKYEYTSIWVVNHGRLGEWYYCSYDTYRSELYTFTVFVFALWVCCQWQVGPQNIDRTRCQMLMYDVLYCVTYLRLIIQSLPWFVFYNYVLTILNTRQRFLSDLNLIFNYINLRHP